MKLIVFDMDGVIYHGNQLIPGVTEFIQWLEAGKKKFLFLTNSSERSPRELKQKLARLKIKVDENPGEREAMLARSGGRRTVPQIFIGERHVGGFDDLYAIDKSGELDRLTGSD